MKKLVIKVEKTEHMELLQTAYDLLCTEEAVDAAAAERLLVKLNQRCGYETVQVETYGLRALANLAAGESERPERRMI